MKERYLDQFYTKETNAKGQIIEVEVNRYEDVFANDSSINNIKQLNNNLKLFLDACLDDLSDYKKIKLRFHFVDEQEDRTKEIKMIEKFRNFYRYQLYTTNQQSSDMMKRSFMYVFVSFVFTIPSIYFQSSDHHELITRLGLLTLTVGGWIFMWEGFSLLFIYYKDVVKKKKQIKRILKAPIIFHYHTPAKKQLINEKKQVIVSIGKGRA